MLQTAVPSCKKYAQPGQSKTPKCLSEMKCHAKQCRCVWPLIPLALSDGLRWHESLEPRRILLPALALQAQIIWRLDCLRKAHAGISWTVLLTRNSGRMCCIGTTRYTAAIAHYAVLHWYVRSVSHQPILPALFLPSGNLHLQDQHCNETGCRPTWWDAPGTWAMTRLWRTCCPCLSATIPLRHPPRPMVSISFNSFQGISHDKRPIDIKKY